MMFRFLRLCFCSPFFPTHSPKYTMMSLAIHESSPGHHLQVNIYHVETIKYWNWIALIFLFGTWNFLFCSYMSFVPCVNQQMSYSQTADLPDFRRNLEYSEKFRVPFAFPSYTAYVEVRHTTEYTTHYRL